MLLHRVLELLALEVVQDLVGGGLADVQDGFALQVVRSDLRSSRTPGSRQRVASRAGAQQSHEQRQCLAPNLCWQTLPARRRDRWME